MVFTNITPFPTTLTPITNISPLTYRDAGTFLEYLETIKQWLNETLVPETDTLLENAVAEFQAGIANAETIITEAKDGWQGQWNEWTTEKAAEYLAFSTELNAAFDTFKTAVNNANAAHATAVDTRMDSAETDIATTKTSWQASWDAFIANVEMELAALSDSAMGGLISDTASNTRVALDAFFVGEGPQGLHVKAKLTTTGTAAQNTTAFNTAMTEAASLGTTVFIPAGTYALNSVSVTAPLKGAGKYATKINGVRLTYAAHDVSVSDLSFHSTDPIAISISNFNNASLINAKISHDAAVVAPLSVISNITNNLQFINNHFGIGGVQLATAIDFVFTQNVSDGQYLNAVNELLHVSQQSSGIISDNTFKNSLNDALDLYSSGEYTLVTNNRFLGIKGSQAIECKVSMSDDPNNTSGPGNVIDSVIISDNIIRDLIPQTAGNARAGIYAEFVDSRSVPTWPVAESARAVIISNNVIEDVNVADPGFSVGYSGIIFTGHNAQITNNIIRNIRAWFGAPAVGINVAWSVPGQTAAGLLIDGNVIAGIENGMGIQIGGTLNRSRITDNIIRQDDVSGINTKFGISFVAGAILNHCAISNNTFSCNVANSFGIRGASSTVTLNRCSVQNNIFKDCGVLLYASQYCKFDGNQLDNFVNSQGFMVGLAGTSSRGNSFIGNTISMSADYGLLITDCDGFIATHNTFNNTTRGILLSGLTKNGFVNTNISITQTNPEFPWYSGVSDPDKATIVVGTNIVLP